MNKLEKLFQQAQSQEIENTKKRAAQSYVSLKDDPRLIHFKPGNTYRFRLLFIEGEERKTPFIHKYSHNYYDAGEKRLSFVVCPTSEYISDRNGFRECPICKQTSDWYKEGEKGSKTSRDLYDTFKRQFNGFALVYVINDPTCEENNDTVKIMRYGINIKRYLKAKLFGIDDKDNKIIEGADPIGIEAFKLKDGRDLIITVTDKTVDFKGKKTVFPEYSCEFASRTSNIAISDKDVEEQVKQLDFDKDFYTKSTKEERDTFYKEFVLKEDVENVVESQSKQSKPVIVESQSDQKEQDDVVKQASKDMNLDLDDDLDDLDDIDDLLDDIENDY